MPQHFLFEHNYDPDAGTIGGPDHNWRVRKIVKWYEPGSLGMPTGIVLFVSAIALETL